MKKKKKSNLVINCRVQCGVCNQKDSFNLVLLDADKRRANRSYLKKWVDNEDPEVLRKSMEQEIEKYSRYVIAS
jgi:hypothetical protein